MSRPAPTPKQNFLQTALLMIVIFLGVNLFLSPKKAVSADYTFQDGKSREIKTLNDYHDAMVDANKRNLDVTLAQKLEPAYNHLIDDQLDAKAITLDRANHLRAEALVLAGDAQLRMGAARNETSRLRLAYNSLESVERKAKLGAAWNEPVELPSGKSISGHELFQDIITTLSEKNKSDLVWGMIPGGYQMIDFLVGLTGKNPGFSYAFAAFLLALTVRSIVFPLSQKQIMSSRQMSQLLPRIKEIKERYADNQVEQNAKVMELYKEYGINPFSGCVPALIQMPLFLTVYQCMLHYQFEFTKGWFLWINPATSQSTHGFVGANLGQNDAILVVIYGVTMCITTLLTPVTDPTQVKQQRLMGLGMSLIFTVTMFLGLFPVVSGFVLYWIFTNLLATAQSLRAYRMPMPPLVKVNAPGGGVYPSSGAKTAGGRWTKMIEDAKKIAEDQQRGNGDARRQTLAPRGKASSSVEETHTKTGTPAKHKPKKRK